MKRIQLIVIAWIACFNVVCGQEYEIEVLTLPRAVRLVAESEEGATNLILLNNRHAPFFLQLSFDEMKKTTIMTAKLVAL